MKPNFKVTIDEVKALGAQQKFVALYDHLLAEYPHLEELDRVVQTFTYLIEGAATFEEVDEEL